MENRRMKHNHLGEIVSLSLFVCMWLCVCVCVCVSVCAYPMLCWWRAAYSRRRWRFITWSSVATDACRVEPRRMTWRLFVHLQWNQRRPRTQLGRHRCAPAALCPTTTLNGLPQRPPTTTVWMWSRVIVNLITSFVRSFIFITSWQTQPGHYTQVKIQ